MPPRNGDPQDEFRQAFVDLAVAIRVLSGTQSSFMRSASSADTCIGASVSTPLLSEALDEQTNRAKHSFERQPSETSFEL